ncbi:DNA repair protein [Aspergillus ellipticus CBS 707.79]|uniref:Protein artemis n=1 Tax=Aspergillus ellipticus CBS 707.79 TaxID=1448320 RepID=A0A319DGX7_9EURO|nr:DNA repair protein [Aspergillus ellipticus CBS 707.79]
MSTFDGIVREFPSIRIDYFRKNPDRPPPLACFLSHVHSDHLQGLESFKSPFIYCSAATRELLLRIEKYPHRMNFSKGVLESRKLHYKHLSKLLRPIPLNTPTELELTPRLSIRVTLLDANHCTGAVMFLIEGEGKAILYTGDIRAEPWWVNSIVRHPILIPYTLGNKRLERIYLDNTFARPAHVCHTFPSKAEGVAELLRKIELYPANTTFYFRAWTFGYEEVWMALSAALHSKVHLDRHQIDLYRSLVSQSTDEASFLCGFALGNQHIPGCLGEEEQCRIHSCEPGVHCSAAASKNTVYIEPIVNRTNNGSEMPEKGAGGGGGDLYQVHELELPDQLALEQLEKLCLEHIHDTQALSQIRQALIDAFQSKSKALSLDSYGMKDAHDMSLESLVNILSHGRSSEEYLSGGVAQHTDLRNKQGNPLPRVIHFPYSRHSSYMELCDLVAAFKPKDIYPCTVDPVTWDEEVSMQTLFGHLCSGTEFAHDQHMREMTTNDPDLRARKRARYEGPSSTQSSQQSFSMVDNSIPNLPSPAHHPPTKTTATTISESLSSSEQIPLPSSFDPIKEPTPTPPNNPFTIPTPPPYTAKVQRDEIRRAWDFLNNANPSQRELYQLNSLPSSWPTDEGNQPLDPDVDMTLYPSDNLPDRPKKEATTIPPSTIPPSTSHPTPTPITSTPPHQHQQIPPSPKPNSQSTATADNENSQPLSLPSSAFAASQEHAQNNILDEDPTESGTEIGDTDTDTDDNDDNDDNDNENYTRRPGLPRSASTQIRRDAYLAARADSFDAWAAISLMSTGNNHTEEEIEL